MHGVNVAKVETSTRLVQICPAKIYKVHFFVLRKILIQNIVILISLSIEPPAIVVRPPSNYSVDVNGTVQLVCVAYGIPMPTITWSRPGCTDISSTLVGTRVTIFSQSMNTSFYTSALQLCNVEAGDASNYTCTANNGINGNGIASSSFSSSIEVNPIIKGTH